MRSNDATPLSSQATASPSMMQERERKRANVSTISGKRRVKSLPGRPYSRTRAPVLAGNDAEAVMLDLVQPQAAGRQLIGFGGEARRDEPGREGRLQHAYLIELSNGDCNFTTLRSAFRFNQSVMAVTDSLSVPSLSPGNSDIDL